jgi:predicted aspartyl protease
MSANTTYKSLADGLPPEIAKQLHPDWYRNEAEYWSVRESLLNQFENQWIAFADGKVIAFDKRPSNVFREARQKASHPFVTCVGREEIGFRMRRSVFAYDTSYPAEALPVVSAEFRRGQGDPGIMLDQVILDTGADTSALPWSDCQLLQLDPLDGVPSVITGVTGSSVRTIGSSIWVTLDGTNHECEFTVDFTGNERILGRNVLNRMDILFRGPNAEIVINP